MQLVKLDELEELPTHDQCNESEIVSRHPMDLWPYMTGVDGLFRLVQRQVVPEKIGTKIPGGRG